MSNKEDIQYLLKTADMLSELRWRHHEDSDLFNKLSTARQTVYDCAMDIPLKKSSGTVKRYWHYLDPAAEYSWLKFVSERGKLLWTFEPNKETASKLTVGELVNGLKATNCPLKFEDFEGVEI